MVNVDTCAARDLQAVIQAAKDAGRRILDVTVSKMSKRKNFNEYTVTEYVVISQ